MNDKITSIRRVFIITWGCNILGSIRIVIINSSNVNIYSLYGLIVRIIR